MARTIKDASMDSRTARSRLKARGKPYWRGLEPGLHLGYRKPLSGAGKWLARHYVGAQAYEVETIATADDFSDADGVAILNFGEAQKLARSRGRAQEAPVESVEDLAAKHGVKMDEVRRFTERAMEAEEDPLRERRVRELAKRLAEGTYQVDAEQVLDMAERRAIADRAAEL